jgi:hypothetical protein
LLWFGAWPVFGRGGEIPADRDVHLVLDNASTHDN